MYCEGVVGVVGVGMEGVVGVGGVRVGWSEVGWGCERGRIRQGL